MESDVNTLSLNVLQKKFQTNQVGFKNYNSLIRIPLIFQMILSDISNVSL